MKNSCIIKKRNNNQICNLLLVLYNVRQYNRNPQEPHCCFTSSWIRKSLDVTDSTSCDCGRDTILSVENAEGSSPQHGDSQSSTSSHQYVHFNTIWYQAVSFTFQTMDLHSLTWLHILLLAYGLLNARFWLWPEHSSIEMLIAYCKTVFSH
jgi:hypothetical protein